MIYCLTLSACHGLGCKIHVVLVTRLSLYVYSLLWGSMQGEDAQICKDILTLRRMQAQTPISPLTATRIHLQMHACPHTHQWQKKTPSYLTCSFPAPKDRSGTAVTWGVTRLGGVRLSRLWESPTQGHRSLPAALAVWKVMGQSLTVMRRLDRVSKGGLGQWGA